MSVVEAGLRSLVLEQHIRYDYSAPVERLRQRLVVVPPAVHGLQRRLGWAVSVDGAPASVRTRTDSFGNVAVEVAAARVEHWIEFAATAAVERTESEVPHRVVADGRYRRRTRLTSPDDRIAAMAAGQPDAAELCRRAHASLTYETGVTNVRTTASEALRGGRGVCQDFAHIMISACRAAGIPARYISGHLVGEGASHAWVETFSCVDPGDGSWLVEAWDPTHDRRARCGYVTVAVGRDYDDVAPVSGSYVADEATGRLSVQKRLADVAA